MEDFVGGSGSSLGAAVMRNFNHASLMVVYIHTPEPAFAARPLLRISKTSPLVSPVTNGIRDGRKRLTRICIIIRNTHGEPEVIPITLLIKSESARQGNPMKHPMLRKQYGAIAY
jgi:hypothetical protein